MSRRRKQGPARLQPDTSTSLSDEPVDAQADEHAGSDVETSLDGEEAPPEPTDQEVGGEGATDVSDAPEDAGEAAAAVGGAAAEASGPGGDPAGWPGVVTGLGGGDGIVVPAPSSAPPPIARFVEDPPASAESSRRPPRRRHAFARVVSREGVYASGYTASGEFRRQWSSGDEGEFPIESIESLPHAFKRT